MVKKSMGSTDSTPEESGGTRYLCIFNQDLLCHHHAAPSLVLAKVYVPRGDDGVPDIAR